MRLEKERQLTEEEMQKLDVEYRAEHPGEFLTTTAEQGASIEEVQAGMKEVEAARRAVEVVEPEQESEQQKQLEAAPERVPVPVPPTTVPA